MASVRVYAEHRDILDAMITSRKVASVGGATRTGPFATQIDAYVFAASIAMAMDQPTEVDKMPKVKNGTPIEEETVLRAFGAKELCFAAALLHVESDESSFDALNRQLRGLADCDFTTLFQNLDRFAYAGFSWLAAHQEDESSIRDLVLATINQIERVESVVADSTEVCDPLLDMLDMQL